jgi:CheY-like chemotaxis protein
MPEMNGLDATRAIRQMQPPLSGVPIVAFTAYATTGEVDKCLAAGMDDYISKPVVPALLCRKIYEQLKRSGYDFAARAVRQDPKDVDLTYLNTMTAEDAGLKSKMLQIMLEETPGELTLLEKHLETENWDGLRAVAHKMKSTVEFMGMRSTLETLRSIELSARDRQNLELLPDKIKDVLLSCRSALQALQEELDKMPES